ncbi:MAG: MarR family transcriptional regulator [Lachnospiraceae bacterium]|nr:MarR family transcriptional regulator [Lachnospiraceae bacterium]
MKAEEAKFAERYLGLTVKTLSRMIGQKMVEIQDQDPILGEIPLLQRWIIGYLSHCHGQDVYQKDLEKDFHVARSTVTSHVKQMEKEGFICRESVESDSRLKKLVLLPKGAKYEKQIEEAFIRAEEQMQQGIAQDDMNTFYRVIDQIKNNLTQ